MALLHVPHSVKRRNIQEPQGAAPVFSVLYPIVKASPSLLSW